MTKQNELSTLEALNTRYGYMLAQEAPKREGQFEVVNGTARALKPRRFKPVHNLLRRSHILWDGSDWDEKTKTGHKPGKVAIRYYDGCTTLFEDEQPKDKATIDDLMKATDDAKLSFRDGYLYVYGYDEMLKKYLDMCSWNGHSKYRVPTVEPVFVPLDVEKTADKDSDDLDKLVEALELAKKAPSKKMRIHGRFLGVAEVDFNTGNAYSDKAYRAEYRKSAKADPRGFIQTYNDNSLELQAWIEKGLESGSISTNLIPNSAVWKKTGVVICDLSGLKSQEAILNKLIEYAKSEAGEAFAALLTAENK
jgi:hypothetical protein